MNYTYHAFGLTIQSEFELPELLPGKGEPDVTVRFGRIPEKLDNARRTHFRFQSGPGQLLLKIDAIADYLVSDGCEIIVQALPSAEPESVRLFLLGSCLGAVLHQRGIFPLHASAISVQGECMAFCGVSGSGKSTLASFLVNRGYELISDDICAITLDSQGAPLVFPEYPQMKLWEDSLCQAGQNPADFTKVRHVLDKYKISAEERFSEAPLRIRKVYVLNPTNDHRIEIKPLDGMAKFNAIKNNTYRKKFVDGLGNKENHFKIIASIGQSVPFFRVDRPIKPFLLEELADHLERDFLRETTPDEKP